MERKPVPSWQPISRDRVPVSPSSTQHNNLTSSCQIPSPQSNCRLTANLQHGPFRKTAWKPRSTRPEAPPFFAWLGTGLYLKTTVFWSQSKSQSPCGVIQGLTPSSHVYGSHHRSSFQLCYSRSCSGNFPCPDFSSPDTCIFPCPLVPLPSDLCANCSA